MIILVSIQDHDQNEWPNNIIIIIIVLYINEITATLLD